MSDDRRDVGRAKRARSGRGWLVALAAAFVIVALQAAGEPVRALLRYDREAVLGGQWWRLASAHFVHLGWAHAGLNVAGLALCAALAGSRRSAHEWRLALAVLTVGVGLMLLVLSPSVGRYVGLSGVLYGLFVWVLAPRAVGGDRLALLLLAVLLGRAAWQLAQGASPAEVALIGGRVAAPAHLWGIVGGAVFAAVQAALRRASPPR